MLTAKAQRRWRVSARLPSGGCRYIPFSLFEGDLVNRLFAMLGLVNRRSSHIAGRSLLLIAIA